MFRSGSFLVFIFFEEAHQRLVNGFCGAGVDRHVHLLGALFGGVEFHQADVRVYALRCVQVVEVAFQFAARDIVEGQVFEQGFDRAFNLIAYAFLSSAGFGEPLGSAGTSFQ